MEQIICIFGASSTQGFYDVEKGGWADRLKIYCYEKCLRSDNFYVLFNLGVSGNTSRDLLRRFYNECKERNPTLIIISLGDNDTALGISVKEYEENIGKIFTQAKEFTKNVIILGLKKVNEEITNPVPWDNNAHYINADINKYDDKLKELAKKHDFEYVPLYDLLENDDLEDGLHPNYKGHKKIFDKVKDVLHNTKLII